MLTADKVTWRTGATQILHETSLRVNPGETFGLVGPNGSGKTSLLRLLAGIRACSSGRVELRGRPLANMRPQTIARHIALVEQQAETTDFIRVRKAVALGRTPYLSVFKPWSHEDDRIVENALAQVDMSAFADRPWHTLSGGERQRVHIARALAQKPDLLLLDEPTNHLDIRHQLEILNLVRELPVTSVIVLHDLNLAAMYCDRVAILYQGRIVACGPVEEVLTPQMIRSVFGVHADVQWNRESGTGHIRFAPTPIGSQRHPDQQQAPGNSALTTTQECKIGPATANC